MKPVCHPPGDDKAGFPVSRNAICRARTPDGECGKPFTQHAVSPDGTDDNSHWLPTYCGVHERRYLKHLAAR